MRPSRTIAAVVALTSALSGGAALADSSYQETTQITGGALMSSMKSIGFLSKSMRQAFAPITTTTMVHGNRKATVGKDAIDIVDLDKEEMIHIDLVRKTYSVMTFAQLRQAMEQVPDKINQVQAQVQAQPQQQPQANPNIKTSFTVDVKNTGASKEVNGLMAQEQLITLTMTVTDTDPPKKGQQGPTTATLVVTTDAWIAPDPQEVKEIQEFDERMAKKMMQGVDLHAWVASMKDSSANMMQMLGAQPGASEAMMQMGKEVAKLKGTHVMDVVSMGAVVPPGTAQANGNSQNDQSNSNSGTPGIGSLGSALGGSIIGGWRRKKQNSNANSNTDATANSTATTTAADGSQTTVLISTTSQKSNFSQGPVPDSAFDIPAGFTQVASPIGAVQQ